MHNFGSPLISFLVSFCFLHPAVELLASDRLPFTTFESGGCVVLHRMLHAESGSPCHFFFAAFALIISVGFTSVYQRNCIAVSPAVGNAAPRSSRVLHT